jgi:hypothetical protein
MTNKPAANQWLRMIVKQGETAVANKTQSDQIAQQSKQIVAPSRILLLRCRIRAAKALGTFDTTT